MECRLRFSSVMRVALLVLFTTSTIWAVDLQRMALVEKAQADFDRVRMATVPRLADTLVCQQSQAALLATTLPAEAPLIRSRKGYCALIGASITGQPSEFLAAARDLDAVPVLASIARLKAGPDGAAAGAALEKALQAQSCPGGWVSPADCQTFQQVGRQWLGWLDLQEGRLDDAERYLATGPWSDWIIGRQDFQQHNFAQAAARYRSAIEGWQQLASEPAPLLAERLAPRADLGAALADLGGAELLDGKPAAAIAALDQSIRIDPRSAWTYYLRARAKDAAGEKEAALADYNMASRTAFAGGDTTSGEAHLYRGVLLYQRKDYARAENEFASALNFDIPGKLRPDAEAWLHLAAVASGGCTASRDELQRSLATASPFFPAAEARGRIAACSTGAD
jgi:tetratricopeptide (TPR) repeat protein